MIAAARLGLEAGVGAVDDAVLGYEHEAALERLGARVALEALVGGVPVLIVVGDLAVLDADRLAARRAVLHVHALEAGAAVGQRLLHEVALAAEQRAAVGAREVAHVPAAALGLGALVREDDLVAGRAARLERLGVVAAAVDVAIRSVVKVDEVDEQLGARVAREARRVPARVRERRWRLAVVAERAGSCAARREHTDGAVLDGQRVWLKSLSWSSSPPLSGLQ